MYILCHYQNIGCDLTILSFLFVLFVLSQFVLILNFWSPSRLNVLLISISLLPLVFYNFLFSQIYSRNYSTHPQLIKVVCPSSDNSKTKRANLTSFNFPLTHMIFLLCILILSIQFIKFHYYFIKPNFI